MDAEFNVSLPSSLGAVAVEFGTRCGETQMGGKCEGGALITAVVSATDSAGRRNVTLRVDYAFHVGTPTFALLQGEDVLPIRVMSDRRSLEVFAGYGRCAASITMLSTSGGVFAKAGAGSADVTVRASAYVMERI